jgi:hypothetical protein
MSPQSLAGSSAGPLSQPHSISDVARPSDKLDGGRAILVVLLAVMLFRSMIDRREHDVDHRLRLFRDEGSGEGEVRSEASLRHEQDLKTEPSAFYAKGLVGKPIVNVT